MSMDGEAVDVGGPWAGPAMQGEAEGSAMGRRAMGDGDSMSWGGG
jgi:hypothetical protein